MIQTVRNRNLESSFNGTVYILHENEITGHCFYKPRGDEREKQIIIG